MLLRVCFPVAAVRQKALVRICPEMAVEGSEPLLGSNPDERPPAALARLVEKSRQQRFERLPLQMVEEDLASACQAVLGLSGW